MSYSINKQEEYLKRLYANRFNPQDRKAKLGLWKVLIKEFIQQYVNPQSSVLDIGGGYCEFINQIQARRKFLIDLNPDSVSFANEDVKVFNLDILNREDQDQINLKFDQALYLL